MTKPHPGNIEPVDPDWPKEGFYEHSRSAAEIAREAVDEIERLRGIIFEAGSTLNAALTYIPAGVQHDDAAEVIEKCANVPDREP